MGRVAFLEMCSHAQWTSCIECWRWHILFSEAIPGVQKHRVWKVSQSSGVGGELSGGWTCRGPRPRASLRSGKSVLVNSSRHGEARSAGKGRAEKQWRSQGWGDEARAPGLSGQGHPRLRTPQLLSTGSKLVPFPPGSSGTLNGTRLPFWG